jgi:hypothetical protein
LIVKRTLFFYRLILENINMQTALYALLILAVLGYYLNRDGKQSRKLTVYRTDVAPNEKPSVANMYESTQKWDVDNEMFRRSDKRWADAEDPNNTGIIPPLYNERTGEFAQARFTGGDNVQPAGAYDYDTAGYATGAEGSGTVKEDFTIHGPQYSGPGDVPYDLTENPDHNAGPYSNSTLLSGRARLNKMGYGPTEIKKSVCVAAPMTHNNMVPFFGSASKQSMDPYAHQTKLEHFTGVGRAEGENKHEVPNFGDIAPSVSHVNGTPAYRENHDRYVVSSKRQNILPTAQIKVAPGVNQGYDAIGTDGFHPSYRVRFRNIDELRVNQRSQYAGKVNHSGIQGRARGILGKISKYRPETDYELGKDRWFTAPSGDALAPKLRENFSQLKCQARSSTLDAYVGGPGNASVTHGYIPYEYDNTSE